MSLVAGNVVAKFTANTNDLRKGVKEAKGLVGGLGKGISKVQGSLTTFGSKFFTLGGAIAGVGMGALALDTLKAGATFEMLEKTLDTVAKNTGTSRKELENMRSELRSVNTQGSRATQTMITFIRSGLAGQVDFKKFVGTVKDFGASVGVTSDKAIQDITKSLITLRPELLETYGIQFNLNQVYSKYAKGLGKTVVELTATEKRQATLNEIFKQGKDVAGVYAETYHTAGKNLLSIKDRMRELKEYIGTAFNPAFREFTNFIQTSLKEAVSFFQDNQESIKAFGERAGNVAMKIVAGLKRLVTFLIKNKEIVIAFFVVVGIALASFVAVWVVANWQIIAIITALTLLIAGLLKAWNTNFLGIRDITQNVVNAITGFWNEHKETFFYIWGAIKEFIANTIATISEWWATYGENIKSILGSALTIIGALFSYYFTFFLNIVKFFIAVFSGDWKGAWDSIKAITNAGVKAIEVILNALLNIITNLLQMIYTRMTNKFTKMWEKAKEMAKKIRDAISGAFNIDKRNSPSIRDRLEDIVNTSNSMLRKVVIPNYSSQISKALGQVNSTIDLTGGLNENPGGNNTIVNNINATLNDGLDIDTLADRLAFNFRNTNL